MKTYGYLHHRVFPYYKVEWRDPVSLCWRVTKKRHATVAAAESAFYRGRECRVVKVDDPCSRVEQAAAQPRLDFEEKPKIAPAALDFTEGCE